MVWKESEVTQQFENMLHKHRDYFQNTLGANDELYNALCNVRWRHKEYGTYSCSWRYAGGLVAGIMARGEDYLHYYCSGQEGWATDRIKELFAREGWFPLKSDNDVLR